MSCKECELLSQLVSLVSYRNINNSHAQLPGEALQSSEYQVAAAWVPVDAVHGLREMGIPMGPWVHGGHGLRVHPSIFSHQASQQRLTEA